MCLQSVPASFHVHVHEYTHITCPPNSLPSHSKACTACFRSLLLTPFRPLFLSSVA